MSDFFKCQPAAKQSTAKMNLDVANLFLFCLISVVIGAVIMLIVQYYVFLRYFKMNSDEVETEPLEQTNGEVKSNEKFILPEVS